MIQDVLLAIAILGGEVIVLVGGAFFLAWWNSGYDWMDDGEDQR